MSSWIHWHEGLFLQPHHLQRFQRGLQDSIVLERTLSRAYPYGVVEAQLSEDDLANRRIRFERLKVVMPSGTVLQFPEHAELPAIDLKQALSRHKSGFRVLLGVPPWDDIRANVAGYRGEEGSGARLHYVVSEKSCPDENTGENPKPVPFRKLNAFLVLEDDDLSNLETLPLLRILPGAGKEDAFCRQDPDFTPPCLLMRGSSPLRNLVYDLTSRIQASRDRLVVQINQGGFNIELLRGLQLEHLLRLRTLNHFSARLPLLVEADAVSPFDMFLELHSMLGELSALRPGADDFKIGTYNHENPYPVFKELCNRIRGLLDPAISASFLKVEFQREEDHFVAELEEQHLTTPNAFFLGIETNEEYTVLSQLVEDQDRFKLMPKSFAKRPVFGIKLKHEHHPPLELPVSPGLKLYRLQQKESGRMWGLLERERALAVRWPGMENSDFKITLYMTVPAS